MKENRTASIPGWSMEFAANVVRQLPRDMDEITAQGWNNNQKALKEALAKALLPTGLVSDPRFELLNKFELTVPSDYIHETRLASFKQENRSKFWSYNDNIKDQNYARVSHKLIPGKTYIGKIFQILKPVSSEDILALLNEQEGNRFAGAQGLSVLWEYSKEKFPVGKWTIAIDKPDNLWKDADGYRRVPYVHRRSDGGWIFSLDFFGGGWVSGLCVLCFCDLPSA